MKSEQGKQLELSRLYNTLTIWQQQAFKTKLFLGYPILNGNN